MYLLLLISEFALDAFKVNAIDYLVKPVETERLAQALARVREHVVLHAKAQKAERIPVEKGGKKILINIDDIRYVMAVMTMPTSRQVLIVSSLR